MATSVGAFGLSVTASFDLPSFAGGAPRPGGHPLALRRVAGEALAAAWSGPVSRRPWRGRLGDGQPLSIEWGRPGDLRFGYGERAVFRLDPNGELLECAPADPDAVAWKRVLLTRVLPNVAIAAGCEALHGSAFASERGVVVIVAGSGAGKSSLALEMVSCGWPLFADDTVVLARGAAGIEAHPALPSMNLPLAAPAPSPRFEELAVLGGERWVSAAPAATEPAPVAAIVLLERGPGKLLGACPLVATPLTLAPFMLGLPDDDERQAARFELYSDLVEDARMLRLSGALHHSPEDLARVLGRALDLASPPVLEEVA